ncbi:MAG: class I SAM-dependent methyltransferase [Dermatophilaceae bacterium]
MSFDVEADAYDRFMGRYSRLLAPQLVDLAGLQVGDRALDVGCGTGALTGELVARLGASSVTAVDPSEPFVDAVRTRYPGVEVHRGSAEALPLEADVFDAALAQLVVHFMADPVAGLAGMRRVARPGGVVVAAVWDFAGGAAPLSLFWRAARALDPAVVDESQRAGARAGHLPELFATAGLREVEETLLSIEREHADFEEWWEPYTGGVGPVGAYVRTLSPEHRDELRDRCREMLPDGPFTLISRAWATRGHA